MRSQLSGFPQLVTVAADGVGLRVVWALLGGATSVCLVLVQRLKDVLLDVEGSVVVGSWLLVFGC